MTYMSSFFVFLNFTSNSAAEGLSVAIGLFGGRLNSCPSILASNKFLLFNVNVTGLVAVCKAGKINDTKGEQSDLR